MKARRRRIWSAAACRDTRRLRVAIAALFSVWMAEAPVARALAPASPRQGPQALAAALAADLRAAASRGEADAQYRLAERLSFDGIDADRTEAVDWLRRAAAQGHRDAQAHLSWVYHSGVGVPANDAEAIKWERLAAEHGQASAQYYLGSDYELGLCGVPKDASAAAHWYRLAAQQNHPIAQSRLGNLYADGRGVSRSDNEALAWYRRAAAQNDYVGQLGLGRMYAAGRGVAADAREALQWYDRAAKQEEKTMFAVMGDAGYEVSQALLRDYGFAMGAERQDHSLGASAERDKLIANLTPQEFAEAQRRSVAAGRPAAHLTSPPSPPESPLAMPNPEDFCPRLTRVMAAAAANFALLRGKGSEKQGWVATEALPGMSHCSIEGATIDDGPPYSYRCAVSEGEDAVVALTKRETIQRIVSQCLGGSWRASDSRDLDRISVFFSSKKSKIVPALLYRHSGSTHQVDLVVYAPPPPIALRGSRAGAAINLDAPVDFKTKDAGLTDVARSFAELLGAQLVIEAYMTGKVTLDRQNVPLRKVLDAMCAQVGCVWSFHGETKSAELFIGHKN
jgi:TPR repeat protein